MRAKTGGRVDPRHANSVLLRPISFRVKIAELYQVLGQRRADGVVGGGGDRDADHATAATFRYFVGFHSRAISRAWAT